MVVISLGGEGTVEQQSIAAREEGRCGDFAGEPFDQNEGFIITITCLENKTNGLSLHRIRTACAMAADHSL